MTDINTVTVNVTGSGNLWILNDPRTLSII
jgi:hypothetical protein